MSSAGSSGRPRRRRRATSTFTTRAKSSRWRTRPSRRCAANATLPSGSARISWTGAAPTHSFRRETPAAGGRPNAFCSGGNTGATWTGPRAVMGMIEGVSRPALATVLPSIKGHTLLLDVGPNVDPKPNHLREFAVMGHFYAQMLFGIDAPRVGLLSIGEEEGKGNELTKETYRVLKETGLNFIGNAEGRDVYNGNADVVVCDGFIGNVVLKASEALGEFVSTTLRQEMTRTWKHKLGGLLAKSAFVSLKKRMDYSEYGGAPLLGVKGGCIVCHGRSNAKAIKNAIRVARDFAVNQIDTKIRTKIQDLHTREHDSAALSTLS